MTPLRKSKDQPGSYGYIDNVRILSMLAIVLLHSGQVLFRSEATTLLEKLVLQLRTFGVPLLFVNSAFLMTDWLDRRSDDVGAYWKSRVLRIAIPWVFWLTAYMAFDSCKALLRHEKLAWIYHNELLRSVFYTPFWFVPILFFTLALMLPLRRYWNSAWLGTGCLILTLLHGVNLYGKWFPTSHTLAFFGYLFPFWFGIQLYRRFDEVSGWVRRLPAWLPIAVLCLTFLLAISESVAMHYTGYGTNALQMTNLLYAFAVLLVIMKFPFRLFPNIIDPRKETFGIYLSHQFFLMVVVGMFHLFVRKPIQDVISGYGMAGRVSVWFLVTVIVFSGCLCLTKLLRSTGWSWTVGDGFRLREKRQAARIRPVHLNS